LPFYQVSGLKIIDYGLYKYNLNNNNVPHKREIMLQMCQIFNNLHEEDAQPIAKQLFFMKKTAWLC
jgi:hypothetical protein